MERRLSMDSDQIRQLAERVLEACRNQLLFEHRFLEQALFQLKFSKSGETCFGSDGRELFYSSAYVLKRYMHEPAGLCLDYLHTVMHCLYQHPFFASGKERAYWDLASDIAIECILGEIKNGQETEQEELKHAAAEKIKAKTQSMSAPKVYAFLRSDVGPGEDFDHLCMLFKRDSHDLWYRTENAGNLGQPEAAEGAGQGGSGEKADAAPKEDGLKMQQAWKQIAEAVLISAQSFAKPLRGDLAGTMAKSLQHVIRENYDYSSFLMKFASRLEEKREVDLDEFDYVFYTYGLALYGNMPLIEPLEYKEKHLIRNFIIVIDTSASCEGKLVEKFLTKTYGILLQTESFTSNVNVHIIQCDACIQEDAVIKGKEDLERYISHLTLKGFGGTDFRPAFDYIDGLISSGAVLRVDGVLYFTDGYGVFPQKPPGYKTAFVFVDRDDDVKVPAWAMKLYLDEESLAGSDAYGFLKEAQNEH